MRELVALQEVVYAGKRRQVGDRFKAGEADARVLVAIKKARPYMPPPVQVNTTPVAAKTAPAKPKRTYTRRDFRAEN